MADLSVALADITARAIRGSAEVTLVDLIERCKFSSSDVLEQVTQIDQYFSHFSLELDPPTALGELDTVRVLRETRTVSSESEVRRLMSEGESRNVEFKESLFTAMRDWKTEGTLIEHQGLVGEALKSICAFLNSDGGVLLVGVADDGSLSEGLELDLRLKGWSADKWFLNWLSLVENRFFDGRQVTPYIFNDLVTVDHQRVLYVKTSKRSRPSFVRRSSTFEYFIRNGPRTESLDLPSFYAYLEATRASV